VRYLKRLLTTLLIAFSLLCILPSIVFALANPDSIAFGTGDAPNYKVFYNVLEDDDWLIVAESFVYYNESTYETIRPDAAGSETSLTPSAGANWACVSDSNDATYVSTNSSTYIRDLYSTGNHTAPSGIITNIGIYFRIMNSGTGTAYGVPQMYIGGNNYNGSAQTSTTAWSTKNEVFDSNPATGNAWSWQDIDNLQVGISLAATANTTMCSEVWVVISYTRDNPGSEADEAFMFELLNSSGNTTYATVPLQAYGDRPIGIYLSASEVATLGLSITGNYMVRIAGNPIVFASPTGNSVNATLGASDYVDQLLGVDGGIAPANNLRNYMIGMAGNIEDYDNPIDDYIVTVKGVRYLSTSGSSIFLEGVPNLDSMCPILFQYSSETLAGDTPDSTGAYQSVMSPLNRWGQTAANGLTNLGVYLGLNQQMAGSALLLVLVGGLAVFTYMKTQSGISVLLLIGVTPFIGAWMGLIPMALAFVFAILIVVLLGFFFLSRGAL
jgi:hypothetical protein